MTTPPPTAELGLPDWMPDEATLNRLAGEFFAAVPGSAVAGPAASGDPDNGFADRTGTGRPDRSEVGRSAGGPLPGESVADPTRAPGSGGDPWGTAAPGPLLEGAVPNGSTSSPADPTQQQLAAGLTAPQPFSGLPGVPADPFAAGLPARGGVPDAPTAMTAPPPNGTPPFGTSIDSSANPGGPTTLGAFELPAGLTVPGPVDVPALDRVGGFVPPAPPIPDQTAVGLPSRPPGGSPPSSPFYFVGESSAYRPSTMSHSEAPARDYVPAAPTATGLPYQIDVPVIESAPVAALDAQSGPTNVTSFYFIDRPAFESLEARPAGEPSIAADRHPAFDVHAVRRDFPILSERVNGRQLIWLDNAATTQKPQAVIDRLAHFYSHENSNIHRAAHELAARATDAYEGARSKVARFLGADSADDIIFVRGATEAINLVAQAWGRKNIGSGDEIVISHLEHHANIVPWQMLASETGAKIRVIPVDDTGQLLLGEYTKLLSDRTKIVSVTQVSNALGTVTPAQQIVELGHRAGAKVLIDGAQSVPHLRVNLQSLGADFFVFSGHKIFGPTGIGVLYGTPEVLADMPPWQGGGNMIADVTLERAIYQGPPNRFEAGTGNIADAVGLGAALDYVDRIGLENIAGYEHQLLEYATPRMREVRGLHLVGTATEKASVLSFVLDGYRTEEVGKALNEEGIAVRAGHHCAQPILRRFGLETTVRPSLAFYNTCSEIDTMVAALHRLAADRGRR